MVNKNPRGSEWRKWDLHVHAPGTRLNDQYVLNDGRNVLEQFCQIIHESDVSVVAIADYFCLDGYFSVRETYEEMYPDDELLLLPNLEVRLPLAVNRDEQEVNLHLLFRPTLTRDEANKFLSRLDTAATTGSNQTTVTCADLDTRQDFESATVSIDALKSAITGTFGYRATSPQIRQEDLLVVASAKGDGIRAGGTGIQRKKLLTDEIDKFSDAFFASIGSRDWFLGTGRLETDELIAPKPVFDGCDAHSFDDLRNGLGKQSTTDGRQRNATWIKADPTYPGLLQTLIEPADRVALGAAEPDQKEPYRVISKVRFSGTETFPAEVVFNRNLNSIIGSRSSGKSALLAFISHAVDPDETVRLQKEAAGSGGSKQTGPAAGFSWDDVSGVTCEVEWESGKGTQGKVIYIPQNSLHSLSEQPDEITQRITPALFRTYPAIKSAHDSAMSKVVKANTDIRNAIDDWFRIADQSSAKAEEIKDLGDQGAIADERDRLQAEIDRIRTEARLTDDEVANYQEVAGELDSREARLKEVGVELEQLASYVALPGQDSSAAALTQTVQARLTVQPSTVEVPEAVGARIEEMVDAAVEDVVAKVEQALVDAVVDLDGERTALRAEIQSVKDANAGLIAKHEANKELAGVVADHKKQEASLGDISKLEKSREKLIKDMESSATEVVRNIAERDRALSTLEETFNAEERWLTDLKFGIETDVPSDVVEHVSVGFNQRSTSEYVKKKGDWVAYEIAQTNPTRFLEALRDGSVPLNKGYEPSTVAADVLTVTKEVRFSAELDSDRIGGFGRSSMTPGKQALFALTLILNESQEPWPLLIDQPEDDLDSRSIYDTIVPYLMKRKKERQIIMVSHNANLVIGADSEQVIVANRHGDDRKNKDGRTFEYFTGALEHSQPLNESSATTLGRFGVREHACEILDGGEEAFQKRREKYKIRSAH